MLARKVIIDCDPGIDDAVALSLALFDTRLDVAAVTAVEGNVPADQASRNVQVIIDQLDPPRLPRLGVASPADNPPAVDSRRMHGNDGLGNSGIDVSQLHHQHPSEKIICDTVRAAPGEVTIIALGPLTNIARAFQRDPSLPEQVDRIIIMGGCTPGSGNATAAAEHNIYFDPISARAVFRSPTTKTLIPLDVTNQVTTTMSIFDELPDPDTPAGALLHNMLRFAFRAHHQQLGLEGIHLHDTVALLAAVQQELFETQEMSVEVETQGNITTGATIFDTRPNSPNRSNMEVATGLHAAAAADCIVRGLQRAVKRG